MQIGIPILELNAATVIRGGRPVLDRLSASVDRLQHTVILGPNGSGKSTMIKLLTGQLYPLARPDEDPPVRIFGRDRWNLEELRSHLGLVSPDLHQRFVGSSGLGPVTGLSAVIASFFSSEILFPHHTVTGEMRERAWAALGRVGAEFLADRPMHEMSTGETRRVLIARALVHGPEVLVLDEPTTGLDPVARHDFLARLRTLAQHGTTLVLVTHHVEEIVPEVEQVLLLRGGQIYASGPPRDVLTSRNLSRVFGGRLSLRRVHGHYELRLRRGRRTDEPSPAPAGESTES